MACGLTTVANGITVVCDNAGTASHTGNHSGSLTLSVAIFGITYNWVSARVYWKTGAAKVVKQKNAMLGESDFT